MEKIKVYWKRLYMHPNITLIAGMLLYLGVTGVLSVGGFYRLVCFWPFALILNGILRNCREQELKRQELDYLAKKIAEESANIANEKEG